MHPVVAQLAAALPANLQQPRDQIAFRLPRQVLGVHPLRRGRGRRQQHVPVLAQDRNVAGLAETQGAQPVQRFPLQPFLNGAGVFPGADQPVERLEPADVGELLRHGVGAARRVPAVPGEALRLRVLGRAQQAAHDVVAGIVPIVEQRRAFQLRRDGQQNAGACRIVDEVIAPPVEETQRAQCFLDRFVDGRVRQVILFPFIQSPRDAVGLVHLGAQLLLQHRFGPRAHVGEVGPGVVQFLDQGLALLVDVAGLGLPQVGLEVPPVLPDEIGAEPDHQRRNQRQRCHELKTIKPRLVGGVGRLAHQFCDRIGQRRLSRNRAR